MDFDISSREDFPFLSTLLSENHPMNLDLENRFSGKMLLQNLVKNNNLDHNCHDLPINNLSLNSHNPDLSAGEGSSMNPFSGVAKTGFDLFKAYANGISADFKAYHSTPLVSNGANPVLHGSEGTGFWDYPQKFGDHAVSEAPMYLPMSFEDQYRSTRRTVADEDSPISERDAYRQKVDEKRLKRINGRRSFKLERPTDIIKGQWMPREDRLLRRLVSDHGTTKWSLIAKLLGGRVGKQCRERWYNHLKPELRKSPWSVHEDRMLIQSHKKFGNRWAEIARMLPGRSENTIKNHWNATKRRRYASRRKTKDSTPRNTDLQDYIRSLDAPTPPTAEPADNQAIQDPPPPTTPALPEESSNDFASGEWQVPSFDPKDALDGVSFDTNMLYDGYNFGPSMLDEVPSAASIADDGFAIPPEVDGSFMQEGAKTESILMEMIYKGH
ncbi:hypothetical protein ACOSQ2_001815 [Xanthoceras sorbifolium]